MWIPRAEGEILAAIEAGDLTETATFDAKAALPAQGKSKDLAVDVAAMANDGGTLIYGVGEDEYDRPIVSKPIELPGAAERVDQIVRTCISEPPVIHVHAIPTEDDAALGYLVVAIPPSPRAPHMVTVGGHNRYYGRSAKGNVPLNEGEVARLYERRRRWEIDREAILNEAIAMAPIERRESFAYLHLVVRTVVPDEDLLDRAKGDQHITDFLNGLISAALTEDVWSGTYGGKGFSPDLANNSSFERRADGWTTGRGLGVDWENFKDPAHVLDFEIGLDGSGRLFCGRAAESTQNGDFLLFENLVAGFTTRFLHVLGGLYAAGAYLGPVDVGVAVTGLRGAVSSHLADDIMTRHARQPYERDEYRRTGRFLALDLSQDPRSAARRLVLPLVRAITQESYDPFSWPTLRWRPRLMGVDDMQTSMDDAYYAQSEESVTDKVVYLFGAGFSAPLGLPVMSNFLMKSKDLYVSDPERYRTFK